jgi:hypothetical protein
MDLSNKRHEKIRAEMIIEVIGRPAEHLTETLNKIADEIGKEKGVEVLRKKVNESLPMKDQKDFFTNFAEIEVEVEEILYLAILMFKYMPAHIEIISPGEIPLTSNGWNDILNELTRRLHGYDEIARVLNVEKNLLERKLRELIGKNSNSEKTDNQKDKKTNSSEKPKK